MQSVRVHRRWEGALALDTLLRQREKGKENKGAEGKDGKRKEKEQDDF